MEQKLKEYAALLAQVGLNIQPGQTLIISSPVECAHFARLCDRLFAAGFFIFWFGFLAVAGYISIRDNQLSMLLFSIPFWLVGFIFAKKRLFK